MASASLDQAHVQAAVYYVAPDGDDTRDGLAPERAWRSLERVNTARLAAGDHVLFRRGGQWRGQLLPQSGKESGAITYGAYGEGPKPSLVGSVAMNRESDWKPAGRNRWTTSPLQPTGKQLPADLTLVECAGTDLLPCDVGNIIFDHGAAWGVKKWNPGDLQAERDYWYDRQAHRVELYLGENPARRFKSIELALCVHNIFCQATNVAFDALSWKPETVADRQVICLDHNCWLQPEGQMIRLKGKSYTQAEFADYQQATGQEAHSLAADPALVDPAKRDFRLRPGSACIDAGTALGYASDFERRASPQGRAPDIGAYEIPGPK